MATDETAKPQRPIEPEFEAVKQALAAREAENRSLRQLLGARTAELAVRNNAYSEQIEHQSATIDVLKAMSASPGDPQPVFNLVADRARVFCNAEFSAVMLLAGDTVHLRGFSTTTDEVARIIQSVYPQRAEQWSTTGRAILERRPVQNPNIQADVQRGERPLNAVMGSNLAVPLLYDGMPLGVIGIGRSGTGAFSPTQIELLKTFAEQAVIAIRSAETHRALQQRTRDLTESLEQQTAIAEILRVINASSGKLVPVFETILAKAHAVCGAEMGALYLWDGMHCRAVATLGHTDEIDALLQQPRPPPPGMSSLVAGARVYHRHDLLQHQNESIADGYLEKLGVRTNLILPLRTNNRVLGFISANRAEVRPYSEKEIALLENFADQAVIAMENARLLTEQREALEQQTATAEVLKVISRSAFDLQTVLDTLIESAVRLCNASRGEVFVRDGDLFHIRAHAGRHLPELIEFLQQNPIRIGRETVTGRVAMTGEVHNIADIIADAEHEFPGVMEHGALRSRLGVPLVRDGRVEGVLHLSREESQPFSPRQVELVSTFADQAVIALENARLFSAVQERTRELTESLEQQTATAEVLKVISRSAFDLQPVLDTLIESAVRLCNATRGGLRLRDGDLFPVRAFAGNYSAEFLDLLRQNPIKAGRETVAGRAALTSLPQNVADVTTDPDYNFPDFLKRGGHRSFLAVPLLRDGQVEGVLHVDRQELRPFTPRQVELVRTFADQAVIAIENARLFDEVQARTQELTQSVSELQALEEVLRAVNSSLDLQTVLSTIIGRAVPLAEADEGTIYEFDAVDEVFVPRAAFGMSDDRIVQLRERRIRIGETFLGRSAVERRPIHVADVQQDASTPDAAALLPGIRAVLAIPLLREDKVIGGLVIRRRSEGAFEEATVKLLQTFATQSVLAIANARLFDEVQARTKELTESLEIQSATADVLKAISRSAFDLDSVLDTLTRSAGNLCSASTGAIVLRDGDRFRTFATFGQSAGRSTDIARWRETNPLRPGRDSTPARVLLSHAVEQVVDTQADPEFHPVIKSLSNNRTSLGVPLLRGNELEGIFLLGRTRVEPFTQRQIELVQTFADQALIAIENARLFNEVQARTRELAKSLDDLRTAQDRLIQTEKLASLGQLTAGIAHEIKNPLNFVNNFSALSVDLIDELDTALTPAPLDAAVRAEVKEITDLLRGNLEKVVQHGRRADGIVKNMLLHARESGGERRSVDLNATVDEALNLAYHGARAEKPGFTITMERNFDPAVGSVELYPQEFTRVMLNLFSNGFYAATRKARDAAGPDFHPTLTVATEARPDAVVILVRDNGTGVPDNAKARLFEPFFTTKPAGEGTGLGLSLSHDIIVKQHGGSIAVDSRVGEYTEFTITLPRVNAEPPS